MCPQNRVNPTKQLKISYVSFGKCGAFGLGTCYGQVNNPGTHKANSDLFIRDVYPIKDGINGYNSELASTNVHGTFVAGVLTHILDYAYAWTAGKLGGAFTDADVTLGIVPRGYFSWHYAGTPRSTRIGESFEFSLAKIGLVEEGFWAAGAHEGLHNYGLNHGLSEVFPDVNGFKTSTFTKINDKKDYHSYDAGFFEDVSQLWTSKRAFSFLAEKLRVQPTANVLLDTKSLLLTGTISAVGDVELLDWYVGQNTPALNGAGSGNFTINLRGENGQLLDSVSATKSFEFAGLSNKGDGAIEKMESLAQVPFLVAAPFYPNVYSIEILNDGEVVKTVYPHVKILKDMIKNLPDEAFSADSAATRSTLNSKIAVLDSLMAQKKFSSALKTINYEIGATLTRDLRPNYQTMDPLKYDLGKSKVLINEVGLRVSLLNSQSSNPPGTPLLELSANKASYTSGERAVLRAKLLRQPENNGLEFVLESTFGGQAQKTLKIGNDLFEAVTPQLNTGNSTWGVRLYLRDKGAAFALQKSIEEIENENISIRRKLEIETDPNEIAALNAKFELNLSRVANLKDNLSKLKVSIGDGYFLNVSTN